ncbi:MAG: hypothetical protein ABJD11_14715 [Gemmatimonadota bacterium]
MIRPSSAILVLLTLAGCRYYDYSGPVSRQKNLVPAEQFARYGREQAIVIAIGREFGRPYNSGPGMQAEQAMNFAKKFPDVVDIVADTLGHRLTVQFKSGWRTAILPIPGGEVGDSTKVPS